MGRVFIEEAMVATGIDRTNLVTVCTHLVRTKQAKSAADAIRRLEAGEFDVDVLEEEMIKYYQTVKAEIVEQKEEEE
jgi:glutamine synthetase